ncbi:rifamycin-inactivating phosphotransferase [Dactylosporangium sp. NPDC049742]|uniref:rifamycin-inactivating phosphotransferase n=1 Tax=Dactylosporangium sp. NPDC049742 TaxID=3154737 RepID=UPI0034466CC3
MPEQYVLGLDEVDEASIDAVGGKGAHLGALTRIDGVRVPPGFCVTTAAFQRVMAAVPAPDPAAPNARVRQMIEDAAIPDDVAAAITTAVGRFDANVTFAVRSSATAEDLPSASFAGQQDTYLNVPAAEVLRHVSRCWASLFTDRAVLYRRRNGIPDGAAHMAVVVQRMVLPEASGVMFTADPVTGDRRSVCVEAVHGLGEALVSGLVNADSYTVRGATIVARTVGVKRLAVDPAPAGGTSERAIDPAEQARPALGDAQVVRLAELGRRIEAHFGRPQDIEWCLAGDDLHVVQSRPITTLFPIPATTDGANHVYLSVGHQQMMTDAMKPLGLSFWQMTTPAPMAEAGGRLFVDVTARVAAPAGRAALLEMIGRSDPLTGDALRTVLDRDGYIATAPDGAAAPPLLPAGATPEELPTDPAVVVDLIAQHQASIAELREAIRPLSGTALLDFVQADLQELRRLLFDRRSHQVFMSAMEAAWWLNEHLETWLGEKNASDPLTQSVPHNVTSEMGLALLDVADVIRPHPDLVAYLEHAEFSLEDMAKLPGGPEARDAIEAWLDTYGMRCAGEIDITRPRWSEEPATLVPVILGNVRNFAPGAAARRFEEGRQDALAKEQELLERLRALPDGAAKAGETKQKIDRVRTFIGYREYPKYGMVSRYFIYKQALLEEAGRLVRAGVLRDRDDVYHLRFDELHEVVRTGHADASLIDRRREEFRSYATLTPPRVLTSDGEAITGAYRRDDVPAGALAGLPVSAGVVEGRARVVLDLAHADLEPGDILVTAYTDPSWTPLFVAIAGLVTEVGGQMTHGAVIAREYGLPAVVAVVGATTAIEDGRRIRVHGTEGYVELLP